MIAAFASAYVLKNSSLVNAFSGTWSRNFLHPVSDANKRQQVIAFISQLCFSLFIAFSSLNV